MIFSVSHPERPGNRRRDPVVTTDSRESLTPFAHQEARSEAPGRYPVVVAISGFKA